jgi:hypothetical protein
MRLTATVPQPVAALLATFALLTTGLVLPAPAAQAGTAGTARCTFVPSEGGSFLDGPAAVDTLETSFYVPAGATAFTSVDGFKGRTYMLGPSDGSCVAHGGQDVDFDEQITLPGQSGPAFEQVFGAGGDSQLRYSCRYLPVIRQFAHPIDRPGCAAVPLSEHITELPTGMPSVHAALVRIPSAVKDLQLWTSGTGPVLALVLAVDHGWKVCDSGCAGLRFVGSSYADCRVGAALTGICLASLQLFAEQALAFQARYLQFTAAGDPGATIAAAIADIGTVSLSVTPESATQGPDDVNTRTPGSEQ